MNRSTEAFAAVVFLYAVGSVAVGVVAYLAAGWAQTRFFEAATGEAIEQLGPAFVDVVVFQFTVGTLLVLPLVGGVIGLVVGSWFYDILPAIGVAGGGVFVGSTIAGLLVAVLASAGTGVSSVLSGMLLVAIVAAAVLSAAVAGVGAAIGTARG